MILFGNFDLKNIFISDMCSVQQQNKTPMKVKQGTVNKIIYVIENLHKVYKNSKKFMKFYKRKV